MFACTLVTIIIETALAFYLVIFILKFTALSTIGKQTDETSYCALIKIKVKNIAVAWL